MKSQDKFLLFFVILYMAITCAMLVVTHRMVYMEGLYISGGTFVIPLTYTTCDIVAEIYGYQITRCLIWFSQICMIVFALLILAVIHLPAPPAWHEVKIFDIVLGPVWVVAISTIISGTVGSFMNAYILTKWKVILGGRFFWLRSLAATAIGEALFVILVCVLVFGWRIPWGQTFSIMIASYSLKIVYNIVLLPFSSLIVRVLKQSRGVDIFDSRTDFNPFTFKID